MNIKNNTDILVNKVDYPEKVEPDEIVADDDEKSLMGIP